MLGDDDSGYPYPVASKVVEGVLTELRIQQAIEENRQAIEALEPAAVLTFDEIWNMGFVTGDWVDEQGYMTESQIQALIGSVGVLTFDDIWGMGFITGDWVNDNFIHKDVLIADYVRKSQLGITPLTLVSGDTTRTETLGRFLIKTWKDGKSYPNDHVIGFLMNETDDLFDSKLDRNEFNDFLKSGVTPEFMDLVAGSLMDVDVEGVKSNLNDALANRPTFAQVKLIDMEVAPGYMVGLEAFLKEVLAGFQAYDKYFTCFKGSTSGMKGMVTSLKSDIFDVKDNFDSIQSYFNDMGTSFEKLRTDLAAIQAKMTGVWLSVGTAKQLVDIFKQFANDVRNSMEAGRDKFQDARDSLEILSSKAGDLETCGKKNLSW